MGSLALRRMTQLAWLAVVGLALALVVMTVAAYVELSRVDAQGRLAARRIADGEMARGHSNGVFGGANFR